MPAATLATLLRPGHIEVGLRAATKAEAIGALVDRIAGAPEVRDAERLRADVTAREARMSTGVGDGLALPHARTPAVTATVGALATLAQPLDWGALDGEPVTLVLLLAGPEADRAAHVRLLAHVSRVLSLATVRAELAAAADADDLRAILVAAAG